MKKRESGKVAETAIIGAVLALVLAAGPNCSSGETVSGDIDASSEVLGHTDATDGDVPDGNDSQEPGHLPRSLELGLWRLASSEFVGTDGEALSAVDYDDSTWIPARVPGTAVAAQVEAGLFDDPYYGDNLMKIPGWMYSFLPMPQDSPYRHSWWWRATFDVPRAADGGRPWLVFEGINYAANIWVNGRQVASRDDVAGTFREFRFDVADYVAPGEACSVALEVFTPDIYKDLAIYWVDWNPEPPDYNQGLWMPARVEVLGDVALRHPAVLTSLNQDGSADLTLLAELSNARTAPVEVLLVGLLDGLEFRHSLTLDAGEVREIGLTPAQVPGLKMAEPTLWWPYQYGVPHLYDMEMTAFVDGVPSDSKSFKFGVREVTAEILPPNSIRYSINGKPILIRGGGWAPDMLYRDDPVRDAAEIAYIKDMGLNTIRLEGKMEPHSFYELCDREGILLMPGWCCCDTWEYWDQWGPEHVAIAKASLESQLRRLRRHPSVFTWLNGSDFHPPPDIEQMYLDVAAAAGWNTPIVSNATETPSELTGLSGMKMTGPYNWVPPNYWYEAVPDDPMALEGEIDWNVMLGGAFSFNSESGPGPSIPPLDSLLRMMPEKDLWPIGDMFLFHSGGIGTAPERLRVYTRAMEARLGPIEGLVDFAIKAQVMQYEAHRAMFEAQGRNKYFATGHIQWMMNNAWPGMIWQLYDYFLRPGGSYFGAKKAMRPVHVQYSYDDRSVWVVNSTLEGHRDLKVRASLIDLDGALIHQVEEDLGELDPDGNVMVLSVADAVDAQSVALTPMFFADLRLMDREGAEIDRNFYWLTVTGDLIDDEPTADNLPHVEVADMTALAGIPRADVEAGDPVVTQQGERTVVTQTLKNDSPGIAFFIEVLVVDTLSGEPILPVLYSDNYVSLLPGESLTLTAEVGTQVVGGRAVTTRISGWNL